jgi:hypothetical protein
MSDSPLILLTILIVGAGLVQAASQLRPRFTGGTAVAVSFLSLFAWLLLRSALPIQYEARLWQWQVDEAMWQVTGVVLLLAAAVCLALLQKSETQVMVLLCTAVTLITIWTTNLMGLLAGWTLMLLVWLRLLLAYQLAQTRAVRWLLVGWLTLWLALGLANWPDWSVTALLVAVLVLMGLWPLHGWRIVAEALPVELHILMLTLLPISGLVLFMRLPMMSQVGGLLATLAGFGGVLWGLRLAWGRSHLRGRSLTGLALVQVSLAWLTAVWAGPDVVVTEVRVFLAIAILLLAAEPLPKRWQLVAPMLALAVLAGLPLTVGFAGRIALYEAWWENGRYLLVIVTTLLHIPLVAGGVLLLWRPTTDDKVTIPQTVAFFGPLLALFSLAGLREAGLVSWLAVLLPLAGGAVLLRFTGELTIARVAIRRAFMLNLPVRREAMWQVVLDLGTAVREAARILEGEKGLVWLLAFVVIVLLVR